MTIIKTSDEMYPIKFDDSWGEGAYLSRSIVMDGKEWDKFIEELNRIRGEIVAEVAEPDDDPDWDYNEDMGYDPYLGCYTDDC